MVAFAPALVVGSPLGVVISRSIASAVAGGAGGLGIVIGSGMHSRIAKAEKVQEYVPGTAAGTLAVSPDPVKGGSGGG